MLFGDILALDTGNLMGLLVAAIATIVVAAVLHRSFTAAAFDTRIALTLGLRPHIAQLSLVGLVTLAVVSSYQAVGSLLVVGLLLAPAVAATPWTASTPTRMVAASVVGMLAVGLGLLCSWYAGTAAGASIAAAAIALAALSNAAASLSAMRRRPAMASREHTTNEPTPLPVSASLSGK